MKPRLQHYCLSRHDLIRRAGAGGQRHRSSFRHPPYRGFGCWQLMTTIHVQTSQMAYTALRLYPGRRAICAAASGSPEFLEQCYVSLSQPM